MSEPSRLDRDDRGDDASVDGEPAPGTPEPDPDAGDGEGDEDLSEIGEHPGLPARTLAASVTLAARYKASGVAVGLLFLSLSMTPSLLPRTAVIQGVLSGITVAVGYGIGVGMAKLWHYLELPVPTGTAARVIRIVAFGSLGLLLLYSMFNLVRWQNDLRVLFDMDEVNDGLYPIVVFVVAVLVTIALIGLGRWLVRLVRAFIRWFDKRVPRRYGRVAGAAMAIALLVAFTSGVLLNLTVGAANQAFSIQNGRVDPSLDVPTSPLQSGSPDSLIPWDTLGSPGRTWVDRTPTAAEIDEFSGGGAMEPIRAYVGIDSADGSEERAQLLLDELIRMGAFDRSVLVLATSTGSGGLDPRGTSTVEYIHNGDTAIAGVQYSFLPSALSFFVDAGAAEEAATTTFETVHSYWRDLDPATRPDLYLFGVSLGSFGSERAATSLRVTGDPIDGAVWAGPTFNNDEWVALTNSRDGGSPAWLPIYDDGSVARFTAGENALGLPTGEWEDNRFVYVQHGSDPVSFFAPDLLFSKPDWLKGERAPDVSKHMVWFPVVTFWQVALDLPAGGSVPRGHGHNFGIPSYVDAWVGVTQPEPWTEEDSQRLIDHLVALDD